jgi:hypothetical protein
MSSLAQRNYYKLYTGTNEYDGHDKVYLGYESESTEINFKKDNITYFHVPFFTAPKKIQDSSLILDGAIPGPVPAMADRIFQFQGNYGNVTHWGTPNFSLYENTVEVPNSVWLCSWLYSLSGESPRWLDRFYNPGKLTISNVLNNSVSFYNKNNPVFFDVPSTLQLEPGTWFQYYHHGEKSAENIVKGFAKTNSSSLRLYIKNWGNDITDETIYKNKLYIKNFKSTWTALLNEPNVTDTNIINFNNSDFIDTRVIYNSSYNLQDEFTLNFWAQNNDWQNASNTQLVGNLNFGGFGVFLNNLKYYPYFVVPETFYGHLLYFNIDGENYLDHSTQPTVYNDPQRRGTSSPVQIAFNSDHELMVLDRGVVAGLYKKDHIGNILATTKTNQGSHFILKGIPKLMLINQNDETYVVTTSGSFLFDKDLTLLNESYANPYLLSEQIAFDINGQLVRELSCLDLKFDIYNKKWSIGLDKNLYYETNTMVSNLWDNKVTNIAIDPENKLWILYGSNSIAKIDIITKEIEAQYQVGLPYDFNYQYEEEYSDQNISFIYSYNRAKNTKKWSALIYKQYDKALYQITLNGELEKVSNLPYKINLEQSPPEEEDKNNLEFKCRGDFTGYEWKRIFNTLRYNNKPQLQFKVSTKKVVKNSPESIFTLTTPIDNFTDKTWHLITCTLKNRELSMYIDTQLKQQQSIPGNYKLNFLRKNDLYIGCPCGQFTNLNKELNTTSIIFDGYIDNIAVYDYALEPEFLQMFVRKRFFGQDLIWNIPTSKIQYIEGIDRFFKHKLPGIKSPFFNVKINGSTIQDLKTRQLIENTLKNIIDQIRPAYTELLKIKWLEPAEEVTPKYNPLLKSPYNP